MGIELSCLLDDLKWCFDTPASTVVELGLMRLGVPAFYANPMADLDVHMVRSTVTANGTTVDLAGLYHRQLPPTAYSATLRIGTTSSGPGARPLRRLICYTMLDNARTPLGGGLCAGHLTQSHLLAAPLTLTLAKRTS